MIFIGKENKNQILTFVPLIKDNYNDWHIVSINLDAQSEEEAKELLSKFLNGYEGTKGFCYLENNKKAVSIMRLGEVESYTQVKDNVEKHLDNKKCRVLAKKMSANGLKQIQIDLSERGNAKSGNHLFEVREERVKNIVLVVDDDAFIRKSVCSLFSNDAETVEVDSGEKALEQYLRINPDVVILDIHMPGKNGLEIVHEICDQDSNAFIIVSSSDAVKENVLKAIEGGAVGFLAKPIQKEKMKRYLEKCITYMT